MSDESSSLQERMASAALSLQQPISTAAERESQRVQDVKRRGRHFQVRLDPDLAKQLRHYADQRHNGVINAALMTIILKFFNGK